MTATTQPPHSTPTHGPEKAITLALSLAQAERAIQAFSAGQIDAVVDTDGRAYLLQPAQERLRASETHLQAIIDSAADVITVINCSGVILSQSRAVSRMLGYEPEELVGHSIFELIYEEELDRLYMAFFNVIEGFQEHATVQFYHLVRNGSCCLIEASVAKLSVATAPCMVLIFRPIAGSSPASIAPVEPPALAMMPASENRDCIMLSHGRSIPLTEMRSRWGRLFDQSQTNSLFSPY
jgi:PAS domain S-box-containing protein